MWHWLLRRICTTLFLKNGRAMSYRPMRRTRASPDGLRSIQILASRLEQTGHQRFASINFYSNSMPENNFDFLRRQNLRHGTEIRADGTTRTTIVAIYLRGLVDTLNKLRPTDDHAEKHETMTLPRQQSNTRSPSRSVKRLPHRIPALQFTP